LNLGNQALLDEVKKRDKKIAELEEIISETKNLPKEKEENQVQTRWPTAHKSISTQKQTDDKNKTLNECTTEPIFKKRERYI